jgi:hypothetical protein
LGNSNDFEKINSLLVEGSFYTDLRNYITAISSMGHAYQFHIDSFNLHTKMLDLFIKNFLNSLGNQKIDYELFIETIDSILVLAESVQNFVEHFKKEQIKFNQEAKKVIEFSKFINKKMLSSSEKYKPFHAHISVNSEMIMRNMNALTNEINNSVEDFIKSIGFAKGVILELKNQQMSA